MGSPSTFVSALFRAVKGADTTKDESIYSDNHAARFALYVKNAAVGDTAATGDANGINVNVKTNVAADGANATFGAKADAAVTDATTTNTHMSFLKGLVKILADVWDSTNHLLNIAVSTTQGAGAAIGLTTTVASGTGDGTLIGHLRQNRDYLKALGEVQASPTANTVLDRLKALLTGIVLAAGTNVVGKVGIDQTTSGTTNAVVPLATESHLGEVGGNSLQVAVTPTISTSPAYSANDVVGGVQTITSAMRKNNGSGILQDLFVMDTSSTPQKAAMEILIYSQNPNHGTYTDNGAFSLDTTDNPFLIRRIQVQASDYVTVSNVAMAVASITNLGLVVNSTNGQANLFAIAVTSGTPTYSAVSALKFMYGFLRD